jgi:lambda family phage tail tape measure protein
MLKAKEDFDKEMEDLDTKHNKAGAAGISDFVFGQETAAAQDAYDKRLAQEKKFAADSLAVQADWRNGSKKAFADYQDQAANIAQQSQTAFTNAFTGMENALVTFATTGKLSFKSFATSVLTDIARMEAKAATTQIFSLLQSLIGPMFGIGGGGGSLTQSAPASVQVYSQASGYAKGGAFNDGMQKFADGGSFTNGIVNTPTNFNIGQMGEAGPEAIVPLTRTSDGSLGIRQTGSNNPSAAMGNVNTVVNVTNSGATSQTKADGTASQAQRQFADAISSATKAEIAKQMLQGGILWRMKNGQTGS